MKIVDVALRDKSPCTFIPGMAFLPLLRKATVLSTYTHFLKDYILCVHLQEYFYILFSKEIPLLIQESLDLTHFFLKPKANNSSNNKSRLSGT
jgi:hypothetical protein